jgi:hypothetical protein
MTRSTLASTEGAEASPAKALTGAMAWSTGTPVVLAISCGVSAMFTNRTPSRDSVPHLTPDAGPPLTVRISGGSLYAASIPAPPNSA